MPRTIRRNIMSLPKRYLLMAATATALGIGGMLLPGATANAATTAADQSVAVAAPVSRTTATATEGSSTQPDTYCYYQWYVDAWGNWYYYYVCY
jgi:hypothetical protein